MREADNKSIFLSVVGVYVVRTSSLNDMHSCQLFRKAASFSSLVLLSSSVSTAIPEERRTRLDIPTIYITRNLD